MAIPQQFQIALSGNLYTIRLTWNNVFSFWVMDIISSSNAPIVQGVPLIPGSLLLSQYKNLGFPGDFFVQTSHDPDDDEIPTFASLGTGAQLYYVPGVGAGA